MIFRCLWLAPILRQILMTSQRLPYLELVRNNQPKNNDLLPNYKIVTSFPFSALVDKHPRSA